MLISGCASSSTTLPTVLTNNDILFFIPSGQTFTAYGPESDELKEYVLSYDLTAMASGQFLELTSKKALKAKAAGKWAGVWPKAVAALFSLIAIGAYLLIRKKK